MKKSLFVVFATSLFAMSAAHANWQYPVNSHRDTWNGDDGMRFVLSVRGGAAYGRADIKNNMDGLIPAYMYDVDNDYEIVTQAYAEAVLNNDSTRNFALAGYGKLGDLPAKKDYAEFSFAAGFSAGFTVPNSPQWRLELGYDHIAETDYNQSPLFEGKLTLSPSGEVVEIQSGAAQSSLASDIYSVMAFYDFFSGIEKPLGTMIPYIGLGAGYADTKTVLQLTDSYGELSGLYELQNFGTVDNNNIIQFNKTENHTSNLAPVAAVGISYGISDKMFMDFGVRAMYLPKIKWKISSSDGELKRDWFSAENMVYINAMIGLRVEF